MKIKMRTSNINAYRDYLYMENSLINVNQTIDLYCKLINDDNIEFNDYINMINRLYNIKFTNNDLLRLSSFILENNSKCAILNTNIMYDIIKSSKVTNYFEYFEEEHKLYLKVSFVDDKDIDFNHDYTSNEINKLIDEKKIVLLDFVLDEEDDMDFYEVDEINGLFPISNVINDYFLNITDIREDYIPVFFTYLKGYFTKDRLKNDLNTYIRDIKIKLQVLEKYIMKIQSNKFSRVKKFDDILIESKKIRQRKISDI